MNVKVDKKEKSQVILEFTVSKEEFKDRLDKSFAKNAKYFKIQGFRPGKAPRNVIEKTYGEGVLYQSAVEDSVDEDFKKAVEENNLEVVSKPELDIKQIGKDKDCIYTVSFYVKPEATVKKYKGLEVEKTVVEVTDEDVDKDIEETRSKNARIITVEDRPLKDGDVSTIDFEGFLNDVAFEGGKGTDFELTIGSGQFIPGFEEQLIGMNIGDTKEIKVTFPTEYHSEELAGKETTFKVTLKAIKEKQLPNLDDEFVKDVSEFETLDEYKKSVKDKILEHKQEHAKHDKEAKVVAELIKNVEVEIPESMVESQIDESLEQFNANLSYQGMSIDKYMQMLNTNMEDMRKQFRSSAENDVKLKLALEYIKKAEDVEVSDLEIDAKIEELAKQYGNDNSDSLKNNENVRNYMKEKLAQEKTLQVVIDSVIEK
jgi:trigger factor